MQNISIQTILTVVIIALAVIYVIYKIIRTVILRKNNSKICGCCNGCPLKENCSRDDKEKCSLY